ncbi:hypothetical protein Q7P37_006672 [Cladosporium fusiforme]
MLGRVRKILGIYLELDLNSYEFDDPEVRETLGDCYNDVFSDMPHHVIIAVWAPSSRALWKSSVSATRQQPTSVIASDTARSSLFDPTDIRRSRSSSSAAIRHHPSWIRSYINISLGLARRSLSTRHLCVHRRSCQQQYGILAAECHLHCVFSAAASSEVTQRTKMGRRGNGIVSDWIHVNQRAFVATTRQPGDATEAGLEDDFQKTSIESDSEARNPELPEWFQTQQRADKYVPPGCKRTTRPLPAVVHIINEDSSGLFGHPKFGTESGFRLKVDTTTTYPTFSINVRTGHWSSQNDAGRERVNQAARKSKGLLNTQHDPNTRKEGHIEDDLEFDPDVAAYFSVNILEGQALDDSVVEVMKGVDLGGSPGTAFGVIQYICKDDILRLPVRTSTQAAYFPPDSAEEEFFNKIKRKPTNFTIVCKLESEQDSLIFQAYEFLANEVRRLSADRKPRNDWFLARHGRYDANSSSPFDGYIKDPKHALPMQEWLCQGDTEEVSPVYVAEQDPKRRKPCRKGRERNLRQSPQECSEPMVRMSVRFVLERGRALVESVFTMT